MKYIALLRGINVGGKNKISMPELRLLFEKQGFTNIVTYINSGNVAFDSDITDTAQIKSICESIIFDTFGFTISVAIFPATDIVDALAHAPGWWNTEPDSKHNAIFVLAPMTAERICTEVGEAKPEYEKIMSYGQVIFWSAPLSTFSRTRWSKIVQSKLAYNNITIRNANTALKLAELAQVK